MIHQAPRFLSVQLVDLVLLLVHAQVLAGLQSLDDFLLVQGGGQHVLLVVLVVLQPLQLLVRLRPRRPRPVRPLSLGRAGGGGDETGRANRPLPVVDVQGLLVDDGQVLLEPPVRALEANQGLPLHPERLACSPRDQIQG